MLKHQLGMAHEDTIDALKAQLGVSVLEVMLLDSMEEYYGLLGSWEGPDPWRDEDGDHPSVETEPLGS